MNSLVHFLHGQSAGLTYLLVFIWNDPWWRSLLQLFTFCCDNLWKSKFMAMELGEFFLYLVATSLQTFYRCKFARTKFLQHCRSQWL